jgi:hypothetical protein
VAGVLAIELDLQLLVGAVVEHAAVAQGQERLSLRLVDRLAHVHGHLEPLQGRRARG